MATVRFNTKDGEFTVEATKEGTVTVISFVSNPVRLPAMQGLGDAVAKVTKTLGIKECGGCKKRREALNKMVPFGTKDEPKPEG
jgi:hypothetical protein